MFVRPYLPTDDSDLAATLVRVRGNGDTYPPAIVPSDEASIVEWCNRYQPLTRLVLEVPDTKRSTGRRVVGHVQLCDLTTTGDADLRDWLTTHNNLDHAAGLELARLFVHPRYRGQGGARLLITAALRIAAGMGRPVSLCVLDTQSEALALYEYTGWSTVGEFLGESGITNHVLLAPPKPPARFDTTAAHSGASAAGNGAVIAPLEMSTTFAAPWPGEWGPYAYTRANNPTRHAFETAIADLEAGHHAIAFASGLAAVDALGALLSPGHTVIVGDDAYGGTWRLLTQVWSSRGIQVLAVDLHSPGVYDRLHDAAHGHDVGLLLTEVPSNPRLRITRLDEVVRWCRDRSAISVVDATLATPVILQPLRHGVDIVLHSATKYLGGHSDVLAGVLATNSDDLATKLRFHQKAVGAVPSPHDCWLLLRSLRTLPLRVRAQQATALELATRLQQHPRVKSVHYPGLTIPIPAGSGLQSGGGLLAFEIADDLDDLEIHRAVGNILTRLTVFTLAESLGSVESLAEHPATMTHAVAADSPIGVPAALIRLAIGLEDVDDLWSDLVAALEAPPS